MHGHLICFFLIGEFLYKNGNSIYSSGIILIENNDEYWILLIERRYTETILNYFWIKDCTIVSWIFSYFK